MASYHCETTLAALYTPSGPRCITREIRPTHPFDTVALQENRKQDFDDDLETRRNTAHPSIGNRIEFYSLGGSSPHYLRGIRVGHTTPEPRSNPNVLPLSESPCLSPPAPRKV